MATSIKTNTIFNIVKTVSTIIFPLIVFPYVTRILQPVNVGKINFGLSIISYFSLLATLGIQTYAVRECSIARNDRRKLSDIASQIYSINVITTLFSYAVLVITLLFYDKLHDYRGLILIQSITIAAITLGTDWLNAAMEDFKFIAFRTVLFQIVFLLLVFLLVRQPDDYMKYAVISVVPLAGTCVLNIFYRKRYCDISFIKNFISGIEWKKHFNPILLLFVMILAQTVFNSVDSTMLGIMHGDREVGIYSVAHKMTNLITLFITSILWVIMPRISYYFANGDYDQINLLLRKVLGFNATLGLPCCVGAFMLADDIVFIIGGVKFADSAIVLRILMVGVAFTLFGGGFLGNVILLPLKKEKIFMYVCLITAVVNVIANYVFIPYYGAIAAAGTTSFCAFLIFLLLLLKIDKRIVIEKKLVLFIPPVIGCLGIILICMLSQRFISDFWIRFSISVPGSIAAYGILQFIAGNYLFTEFIREMKSKLIR